jgi:serine/threonine-protein kinase RsbW
MSHATTYDLTIPSDRESIRSIEPFIASIEPLRMLGPERYYNMLLAITEAVNNAIIHGNGCDAQKMVSIVIQCSSREILMIVRDQGHGFDESAVPDPRQPDRLLVDGGRGIFLIRQLSDVVEFHPSRMGTTVFLHFFLP